MKARRRNQGEARRIARLAYPYPGCCLCGQTVGEQVCHLNHDASDNDPNNLAWLCHHHHWMFDIGLFSLRAVKLQRKHWQAMKGKATNPFMKDAGKKAAATRATKGIGARNGPQGGRHPPGQREGQKIIEQAALTRSARQASGRSILSSRMPACSRSSRQPPTRQRRKSWWRACGDGADACA